MPGTFAAKKKRASSMSSKSKIVKSQPLIVVRDVEESSVWYRKLLSCKSGHGGPDYERLMSGNNLILQLHAIDVHGHDFLGKPPRKSATNGFLLWFEVPNFEAAVARAKKLKAKVLEKAHVNPNAGHWEIWLQDPDGYVVVLAG